MQMSEAYFIMEAIERLGGRLERDLTEAQKQRLYAQASRIGIDSTHEKAAKEYRRLHTKARWYSTHKKIAA